MRLIPWVAALIAALVAFDVASRVGQAQPPDPSGPRMRAEHDPTDEHAALPGDSGAAHGATGHGAAAAGGHGGGGADPLSVDPDLAVWTFVVFLVLLIVLWKFAWGPISKGLDAREESVAQHIAEAQRIHDEAKALLVEYERKLASAADQVRELFDEARRDAEQTKAEILAEAKAGAELERARALREIETATDHALSVLSRHSADLAVELAGKIVQAKLTPADHARLVQDALARFPQGSPSQN